MRALSMGNSNAIDGMYLVSKTRDVSGKATTLRDAAGKNRRCGKRSNKPARINWVETACRCNANARLTLRRWQRGSEKKERKRRET